MFDHELDGFLRRQGEGNDTLQSILWVHIGATTTDCLRRQIHEVQGRAVMQLRWILAESPERHPLLLDVEIPGITHTPDDVQPENLDGSMFMINYLCSKEMDI